MSAGGSRSRHTLRQQMLSGRSRGLFQKRRRELYSQFPRPFESQAVHNGSGRFAVVGDLQRTSSLEFWRESNHAERERIISQIAAEAPDFLAIVGDLVFRGSSAMDWAEFDELSLPLHRAAVPVLPVLGNHEYWFSRRPALTHFFTRFPYLNGRHWYAITYGPLGLIFLNSNQRRLTRAQWQEQLAWYRRELTRCDHADDIQGVLVFLHHAPYTNSCLTSDAVHVQQAFVPPFVHAHKTLAMISGHIHSYERFLRTGKTFLVTGGGGGPRVKLATGQRRRHIDDLFAGPPLRWFHYLMLASTPTGIEIEMRGLPKYGATFETLDRFLLPWVLRAERVAP